MKLRYYTARLAETDEDVRACQRLRYVAFIEGRGLHQDGDPDGDSNGGGDRLDADEFDPHCRHMMVEEVLSGALVCCFRMMPLDSAEEISRTYSAKYYDLEPLRSYPGKLVEMGRFCVHPDWKDPAIVRVAWGAITRFVDREEIGLLFGCSSFEGVDADDYMDAFALLKEKHLAPRRWLPRVKAPQVFRFARMPRLPRTNVKLALGSMPPLLRTYLTMGGWVSDHAVIDTDLNTLHVFTGVEVNRVPESRARLLRRI